MGIRQTINEKPAVGALFGVVLIAAAVAALWYTLRPTSYGPPQESFYTVDDGQTLFKDSVSKPTPFDRDGKEAVKAYVYTCDGGKTQFVAYLEKMPPGVTPAQLAPAPAAPVPAVEASGVDKQPAMAGQPRNMSQRPANAGRFVALVRKPGQKDWIKPGDPRYFPTIAVNCPAGTSGVLDLVTP